VRPSLYEDTDQLSYVIASNAGLSVEQQQALLVIDRENERLQFLVEHLEEMIPRVEQVESVQKKIRSNGHFKDFPPEDLPPDIDA